MLILSNDAAVQRGRRGSKGAWLGRMILLSNDAAVRRSKGGRRERGWAGRRSDRKEAWGKATQAQKTWRAEVCRLCFANQWSAAAGKSGGEERRSTAGRLVKRGGGGGMQQEKNHKPEAGRWHQEECRLMLARGEVSALPRRSPSCVGLRCFYFRARLWDRGRWLCDAGVVWRGWRSLAVGCGRSRVVAAESCWRVAC